MSSQRGPDDPTRRDVLRAAAASLALFAADGASGDTGRPSARRPAVPPPEGALDVIIIGGGLAGLAAARDLSIAGNHSFVVLEAQDRVGGRTLNHELRDGYVSEAGGQWIGPGHTAIADLARELHIDTFESRYDGKAVNRMGDGYLEVDTDGDVDVSESLVAKFDALAEEVPSKKPWTVPRAEELDRMSLADWLVQNGGTPIDRLTWQFSSILTNGTPMTNVSLLYYLSMINFAGGFGPLNRQKDGAQETRFVGGSQILSIRIAEALADRVRLATPVLRISGWDRPVTEVHTPAGVYRAKQVILALSPPLCQRIDFSPALPKARAELQRRWPAHGPMAKTAMVYDSPFWFDEGYNGQIASFDGPLIWSFDNSPPDERFGVINAFMRAAAMPGDHDAAMRLVASVYADTWGDDRYLEPLEFHAHDWGQDPYIITCVSPMPPGLLTSGLMPALTEPVGSLHWAGTETAEIWNGYMDGAVRSGHKAALLALQRLASAGAV